MFNITIYSDDLTQKTTDCDLSTLTNGTYFFHNNQTITDWNNDLSSLKHAKRMFSLCYGLEKWDIDLPNLTDGYSMFYGSGALTSFKGNLPSLQCGAYMFYQTCLDTFITQLPSLDNAYYMFHTNNLKEFNIPLPKLANGHYAFTNNASLYSFTSDLPNLVYALYMFKGCSISNFRGSLNSLISGHMMFSNCQLDPDSLLIIIDTINDINALKEKYTSGKIPFVEVDSTTATFSANHGFTADYNYIYTYSNPNPYSFEINNPVIGLITIGLGCSSSNVSDFLAEIGYSSISEIEQEFSNKGWSVSWQYNGPATMSLGDTHPSVFTKLVEVPTLEEADFTSKDGSQFFVIDWYHRSSSSTDDYT